jgi:hypothetical protein
MAYLITKDPASGKTPVEVYIEKQTAWAAAQDAWDSAKIKARRTSPLYIAEPTLADQ